MEWSIQAQAFSLLQNKKFAEAIAFLDANNLFDEGVNDWEVLKLFNNYLIACLHSNQIEKGVTAAKKLQDVAPFNPLIYHNAACIYTKSGSFEIALTQIKLARKFGGIGLIAILKNDVDLAPLAAYSDFIELIKPVQRKYQCEKIVIPFEGVNHFQFDDLEKDEMVSMFFIFKGAFDDIRKEGIISMINTIASGEEWANRLVENTAKHYGWRDGTVIGKDFITLHLKDIWQPRPLMVELYNLILSFKEELVESFFVKRELEKSGGFGTVNHSINESSLATIFKQTTSEEDFWNSSFNYAVPYPSPEYTGQLKYYGHHDGSESAELRSLVYDPLFRISYGLVKTTIIEDTEKAKSIYHFLQDQLSKYFEDEIPTICNAAGELKVDRITAHSRIGYALEITNDEILECFYTRYVLRVREEEIFKAIKDTIVHFKLTPIIHWYRNSVYAFNLWERME